MSKNIYALLVGIVDYDDTILVDTVGAAFPALYGCVNDACRMRTFLEDNCGPSLAHVKELYNSQATKENICSAFLEHLGQAKAEDAVFFYYSGHGTQEIAHPCWTSETNGRLESLVCYYSRDNVTNFLLADKELRYLIRKIAAVTTRITVVLDCCHSGDMTRNAEVVKVNYDAPIEKKSKGSFVFPRREWKNFIFQRVFNPSDVAAHGGNALLPEGDHILFSASESDHSAFEINGEGAFTRQLIDVLQLTKGYISNQMLFDRISMRMKYAFQQTPRLYVPKNAGKLRENSFLPALPFSKNGSAAAWYNRSRGWVVNRGEINGLYEGMPGIELVDSEDPAQIFEGQVMTLEMDHAILRLPETVDTERTYYAHVDHLSRQPIRLYLALDSAILKDVSSLLATLDALPSSILDIVSDESDADFTLQHFYGIYYLSRKNDKCRPVSEVFFVSNFSGIAEQIKHLASWKFVHGLSNKASRHSLGRDLLEIEYALGRGEYKVLSPIDDDSVIRIEQWDEYQGGFTTSLRMNLTNRSGNSLYVALLYLDINFYSGTDFLQSCPCLLKPGDSVDLNIDGNPLLSVDFYPQALFFNYLEYTERFKIIVSDRLFEIYPLKLDPLPESPLPGTGLPRGANSVMSRGSIGRIRSFEGFVTVTIDIVMVNPFHNKITASNLRSMLDDKVTSAFAEAIYYEKRVEDENDLTDKIQLRPEIIILEGERERSVTIELANWWARRNRNRYYEDIVRRFPGRTRIVSEGDSWFQHPLVYDVIDHLSKIYAVQCVAAAGDTLENYFSGAKKRGDYFLDVLSASKPPFFLISGGGNDILGPQFRSFLVDQPYKQKLKRNADGSQFLKESFTLQLEKLMDIYESIFSLLGRELPDLITIVHGYDYPVHLDHRNKGWLGRYMIEKGISEPSDRRSLVRYIIDEFNRRLEETAALFPSSVRYLDLRGTVLYKENEIDQWYDEIHPNMDGFQSIGLKFIKLIESLKQTVPAK